MRYVCELVAAGVRIIRNEGWRSFFRKLRHWLTRSVSSRRNRRAYTLKGLRCMYQRCTRVHEGGILKVLYIPYAPDNPSHALLIDSLRQNGACVDVGRIHNRLSLIKSIGERGKPHVIHLHWAHFFVLGKSSMETVMRSLGFLLELAFVRICGIKIVWTVHNLISHESLHPRLELLVNRMIARLCNELIVHTDSIKLEVQTQYRQRDSRRISVVHPVSYVGYYDNSIDRQEARRILKLNHDEFIFMYFGKIRGYKGVSELIDCFTQLGSGDTIRHCRLLIVGKPFSDEIRHDIADRCAMNKNITPILKWVADQEVQTYMSAADIAVFPFESILNTASVVLAMSFGKPIIAPAMGSVPDILDTEGGFTYPASVTGGLLSAMRQALDCEPGELAAMGERNLDKMKAFAPEIAGRRTIDVYRRCFGEWRQAHRLTR